MTRSIAVLLAAALTLSIGGCGKAMEPYQDAPVSGTRDNSPAEVYDMPDGFSNFTEKCDRHGNRIIVVFHGNSPYAAVAAIPQDPSCKK